MGMAEGGENLARVGVGPERVKYAGRDLEKWEETGQGLGWVRPVWGPAGAVRRAALDARPYAFGARFLASRRSWCAKFRTALFLSPLAQLVLHVKFDVPRSSSTVPW